MKRNVWALLMLQIGFLSCKTIENTTTELKGSPIEDSDVRDMRQLFATGRAPKASEFDKMNFVCGEREAIEGHWKTKETAFQLRAVSDSQLDVYKNPLSQKSGIVVNTFTKDSNGELVGTHHENGVYYNYVFRINPNFFPTSHPSNPLAAVVTAEWQIDRKLTYERNEVNGRNLLAMADRRGVKSAAKGYQDNPVRYCQMLCLTV